MGERGGGGVARCSEHAGFASLQHVLSTARPLHCISATTATWWVSSLQSLHELCSLNRVLDDVDSAKLIAEIPKAISPSGAAGSLLVAGQTPQGVVVGTPLPPLDSS